MQRTGTLKTTFALIVGWLVLGAIFVLYTARSQRMAIDAELRRESATLHRLVSQRADQHDAHLTSLSALALADDQPRHDLFLQVAAAIRRFYPRVSAIDLIPLSTTTAERLTTRDRGATSAAIESTIRDAAVRSSGELILVPSPASPNHYLIVKRSPNTDQVRFGLALEIDAQALVETDAPFWRKPNTAITLTLTDGTALTERRDDSSPPGTSFLAPLTTTKALGSSSQPLLLATRLAPLRGDIYPAERILAGLVILGGLLVVAALIMRLLSRTRSAELRARLGEQEARIAHASRVNTLGEMALGMAHELTQPLTAILSRSQAGVRLIAHGDTELDAIDDILKTIAAQSKRAGDILLRLREWSKTSATAVGRQSLNECIGNVSFLLGSEARRLQIDLGVRIDQADPLVLGDAVEIEQVIFNLIRNAMDALEHDDRQERRIDVSCAANGSDVVVEIADNGPGIAPDMRARLFEPFASGRKDGMGLGLVLCERIVERMQGRIEICDAKDGGVIARVILPLAARLREDRPTP